ncbi:MAG: ABC transporter permease [Nigerium sp.]|nr:ABC transporter permease [Nigerium sp.]
MFVVIVVAAAVLSNGAFATPANLRNLLFQGAILGVCALGQYIVVITGGIDLSVGTTISLSSVIFVSSMGLGVVPAVALALAGGLVVGLLNGALVAFLRLPPFVVTLAVSQIAFSAAQIITDGAAIDRAPDGTPIPEGVTQFGSALFLGLPVTSYVWVLAIGLVVFYLRTRSGRFLFPVGGNERAARISAIPVTRVRLLAYAACSVLAAVGGLLFSARIGSGDPVAGTPYLLDSIAAVVIGGASLFGGSGTILGTILGVLTLGVLSNLTNLVGISPTMQQAVKGVVIILAVFLNTLRRR